ncbi:MAG TPA: tRNA pseudouridine(55) synthase TruB [Gemmataceae bacterium]|nr:tRNA pseudouridine(55) synthase TruB [Gemmataceae bacterium]
MQLLYHGLLIIDKPTGMTSRDVVNRVAGWFPRRTRFGHTGTLDPLATGVLVLCVGNATRLAEYVQDMTKTYRAGLVLGLRSDTNDADGTVETVANPPVPDLVQVKKKLAGFLGTIDQVPPDYSAARLAGRRAYQLARRGQEVELHSRPVRIDAIDILDFSFPRLDLEIRCGKGTYIRSLARDLGDQLGCGALVATLRRTRVGTFTAEEGLSLEAASSLAQLKLLPMAAAVADFPSITLKETEINRLRQGQKIPIADWTKIENRVIDNLKVAVYDQNNNLVAVAFQDPEKRFLNPCKVFCKS